MVNQSSLNELALFAGAGGGILGGKLLGWRTICAVEWEQYPASVLCARQNDGLLPPFPIWDDVQTFDGHPWRGIVDVISGGFPCTDISAAGKGAGIDGEASGMWREMARIICEVRPGYVFVENSPMLTSRGLGRVLGDLASMGFDARWGVLGAKDVGANHQRDRIWIVAKWRGQLPHAQHDRIRRWKQQQASIKEKNGITNTDQQGLERRADSGKQEIAWAGSGGTLADSKSNRLQRCNKPGCNEQSGKKGVQPEFARSYGGDNSKWWSVEPNILRVADGVAARVDRIKAIGNGQVPLCAATAWNILNKDIT